MGHRQADRRVPKVHRCGVARHSTADLKPLDNRIAPSRTLKASAFERTKGLSDRRFGPNLCKSDFMKSRISATKAARNFFELMNRVRYRSESFIVERGGKPICEILPARLPKLARPPCEPVTHTAQAR